MGKSLIIKGADFSANCIAPGETVAITVNANVAAYGTTTGSGNYEEGSEVTITATANTGYEFVEWSDGNTNASRTITVGDSAATYTAIFGEVIPFSATMEGKYYNASGGIATDAVYNSMQINMEANKTYVIYQQIFGSGHNNWRIFSVESDTYTQVAYGNQDVYEYVCPNVNNNVLQVVIKVALDASMVKVVVVP